MITLPPLVGLCSYFPAVFNTTSRTGLSKGGSGKAWEGLILDGAVEAHEDPRTRLGA